MDVVSWLVLCRVLQSFSLCYAMLTHGSRVQTILACTSAFLSSISMHDLGGYPRATNLPFMQRFNRRGQNDTPSDRSLASYIYKYKLLQ